MRTPNDSTQFHSRYSRQVLFGGISVEGQARIMASRVVIVGCGALGTVQASLLARAGVGRLRIIDRDFVEESNLQRQMLFDEDDVRAMLPKAVAAEKKLRCTNSMVEVEGLVEDLHAASADRLLGGFDLIMDATDNFDARYLINDYAVKHHIPWVYGACVGAYGLTFPVLPEETPCLRCIFEHASPPGVSPSCDTAGVIGPIACVVASIQAAEALKILAGKRKAVHHGMTSVDLWDSRYETIRTPPPRSDCPCCGLMDFAYLDGRLGSDATALCGRNAVQIRPREAAHIDLEDLGRKLQPLAPVSQNRFLLRAAVDGCQLTVFPDGRAIISGTYDAGVAKSLYARYIGN